MVVIRRSGQSRPVLAKILGRENDDQGQLKKMWLDRIVHRIGEREFDDGDISWHVSGATSSILCRNTPCTTDNKSDEAPCQ